MRRQFRFERPRARSRSWLLLLEEGPLRRAWTVDGGPSLDPTHVRKAREVDVPDASQAVAWDSGPWSAPVALAQSSDSNEVAFSLRGSKLLGAWSLRRTGARWEFSKAPDEFAIAGADAAAIDEAFAMLEAQQPARDAPLPKFVPLALATLADAPPPGDGWIHEVKFDGYRIEALVTGQSVRLMSRNEKDWTARFPRIASALGAMQLSGAVLDGEIIAVGKGGVSSFQQLQQSMEAGDAVELRYHVFDVLALDGRSLLQLPLSERLPILERVLSRAPKSSVVQPSRQFDPARGDVLEQACRAGEEGVISKRLDARYMSGRGRNWIKSKCGRRQEFVIVGFTDPQGSRTGFGSLLLAVNDEHGLRYAGRVGTGFDTALLDSLYSRLKKIEVDTSPLHSRITGVPARTIHWVKPQLVAEVAFTEWTDDGLLRHPSFKGLRQDKSPSAVRRED